MIEVLQNYIDGQFVSCSNHIDSYNPATGEVHVKVPDSGQDEVDKAVKSAKEAFVKWSRTPAKERAKYLHKIADAIETRLEEFAVAESRDQGKPVWLARSVDIPRACLNFRFFATAILHQINMSTVLEEAAATNYTHQAPIGVAGLISPWNLPLYLLTFKIAPALAAGDTVVCKPSEMTSLTAHLLAGVMNDVGLPKGVCNMVYGVGPHAGEALVTHPDVPLISFTGGTVTGAHISAKAAPFCKRLSLELGGKNAGIVFEDVDLDKCIPTMIRSSFANQGEICLTTSRIYVHRSIYDDYVKRFVEAAKNLTVGDPSDSNNKMGALVSKEHLAKVTGYVEKAEKEGATICCGKEPLSLPDRNKNGYFMRPTVITNIKDDSPAMTEEIFGPVVCITPFDSEDEVICRANSLPYGLAACVWTESSGRTHRVSQQLDVGTVWVNCWMVRDLNVPFGGAKKSGIGREGLHDSLNFYTEVKTICIKH
ncbi:2-aminomuconic semialdehyde dehydrogenase-like [Dysidea avara]|uniref:2-aminomuconic semialdehyde dehydrogenase-like n=1 Tax=Dysidea avara TaxID=196820 RepID=UPI00331DEBE4